MKKYLSVAAAITGVICWNPLFAAEFEKGLAAYVKQDYATALKEWTPLADQGDAIAQVNLGQMYFQLFSKLEGFKINFEKAYNYFTLSAEQGNRTSQYFLARMYQQGNYVPQDYLSAHMWSNIAAAAGHVDAKRVRHLLESKMPREQIAEAQRLARECIKKGFNDC